MSVTTKRRLLDAGLRMLLERGYNSLGILALLKETQIPKGSFYHHFKSKADFAHQTVDLYMTEVHAGLDACLGDESTPPLQRVRNFFESTEKKYQTDGYLGCLLGGLGQELAGVSDEFRKQIDDCFCTIAERISVCFEQAKARGELPAGADSEAMANVLVNCWEGAALRTRLLRDPAPLSAMLDFYFRAASMSQVQTWLGAVAVSEGFAYTCVRR